MEQRYSPFRQFPLKSGDLICSQAARKTARIDLAVALSNHCPARIGDGMLMGFCSRSELADASTVSAEPFQEVHD